jgi:hypothetical protein
MFGSFYFCLDDIKERFVSAYRLFIWVDGCHLKTAETKTHRFLNGSRRQWLKPTNFEHYETYLQQKKLYGQKPKNRELTETKMIFKPFKNNNSHVNLAHLVGTLHYICKGSVFESRSFHCYTCYA